MDSGEGVDLARTTPRSTRGYTSVTPDGVQGYEPQPRLGGGDSPKVRPRRLNPVRGDGSSPA
jgi:hypothetical protein